MSLFSIAGDIQVALHLRAVLVPVKGPFAQVHQRHFAVDRTRERDQCVPVLGGRLEVPDGRRLCPEGLRSAIGMERLVASGAKGGSSLLLPPVSRSIPYCPESRGGGFVRRACVLGQARRFSTRESHPNRCKRRAVHRLRNPWALQVFYSGAAFHCRIGSRKQESL